MKFDSAKYRENKIYSQSGQDAFVLSYFNEKMNGVFVEVGASNGIGFSNTYYLEKELGWTGICFEPNPTTFKQLEVNRNCIKVMGAVSDVVGFEKFTIANNLSGLTKDYDKRHVKRIEDSNQYKGEIDVECVLLADVLAKHNIYYIDYLSIDTEGNEFKIIKSIDFKLFDIELITIENNYRDSKQSEFLLLKGYELLGKIGADDVYKKIRK